MNFDWSVVNDPAFHKQLHIPRTVDRDDALQGACLKLIERRIPVTLPLLRQTTLNKYKDDVKAEIRRKAHERLRAIHEVPEDSGWPDTECRSHSVQVPQIDGPDATDYSPSTRIEHRERRAKIKRAVRAARLPRNHRCALWASSRGHLAEFVRRRGIPPNTARTWVKRAIGALRPHLEREGLGAC